MRNLVAAIALAALAGGCAPAATAPRPLSEMTDAAPCMPPGLTREMIRSWTVVEARVQDARGYPDGTPDQPILTVLYAVGERHATITWTVTPPQAVIAYDRDADDTTLPALSSLQFIEGGRVRAAPAGACLWRRSGPRTTT